MAGTAQRSLKKAITQNSFDPVYLFSGEEEYLKKETLRQVIEKAAHPATRDFNLDIVSGGDLSIPRLDSLVGTPPLMAPRRIVVVEEIETLKKPVRSLLERYIVNPAPDILLILVASAGDVRFEPPVQKHITTVEFQPLSPAQGLKWIGYYATEILGVSITPEAAILLQAAGGNDLPTLASEMDKLASYTGGDDIDEAAVSAIVGIQPGKTVGDLLDSIVARDTRTAIALIPEVLAQPKTTGVFIIMALSVQLLGIGYTRARLEQGMSLTQAPADLRGLLQRARGAPLARSWTDASRTWVQAAATWNERELKLGLDALVSADAALKESRVSSDEDILVGLTLALCGCGLGIHALGAVIRG